MPSSSTLAEERAKNGSSEPFRVRYWGVGNENWGCGGRMRPEVYADHYRQFSVYIREFGGTKPFLVASGPNGNDTRWTRGFMDTVQGGVPDGISMHYYEGGKDQPTSFTAEHMSEQLSVFAKVEEAIIQQRSLLDGYSDGRKTRLILDEWGVWDKINKEDEKRYGALWQQSTMRSAVAAGLGLNIYKGERLPHVTGSATTVRSNRDLGNPLASPPGFRGSRANFSHNDRSFTSGQMKEPGAPGEVFDCAVAGSSAFPCARAPAARIRSASRNRLTGESIALQEIFLLTGFQSCLPN